MLLLLIFLSCQLLVSGDCSQYCLPDTEANSAGHTSCATSSMESTSYLHEKISVEDHSQKSYLWSNSIIALIAKPLSVVSTHFNYLAAPAYFSESQWPILQHLSVLMLPAFYGFLMVFFSWLLVYYDSSIPGVNPPTPISPQKHRDQSGHTFHLGYTIGLINGLIVFALTLWQQMFN